MNRRELVRHFAPRLEETIGFLLWDTTRAYQRALSAVLARHGMRTGWYSFLRAIYEHDGLTFRELSDTVHTRTPTTVEAVHALERRGLVQRKRNAKDARKSHIHLTPKGRRLHEALVPESGAINRDGVAGLSRRQQATLKGLLRHLRANMNARTGFDV